MLNTRIRHCVGKVSTDSDHGQSVSSAVDCLDSSAAGAALINFLMGTTRVAAPDALSVFAPYRDGARLYVPMVDSLAICRQVPHVEVAGHSNF